MKLLLTDGAGFIGSNFIHYWLENYPDDMSINLDAVTYAGNPENLRDIEDKQNYKFTKGDIGDLETNTKLLKEEKVDAIVNFAAESHNGRAMIEPDIFKCFKKFRHILYSLKKRALRTLKDKNKPAAA